MPRLLGIDIPNEKRIEAALPYVYGIGRPTASRILREANIDPDIRAGELTDDQLSAIVQVISANNLVIEGDLRRDIQSNLKRLQQIQSVRGLRHRKGLPVRGQRTKTNARTRKGKRRTVGASK
ncbi:30S ribosomal protein S13 [Sulfuriroseicoccus oceanibius]|uniref:Small ribosomal subunit protein uS13 n=1 Tax=Sulfuriroseicoccus oceanibius TaxID=2707525 RepID=A0A6B3LBC1_9BACT|nr:30S ribosomal protein S13 [Sulfuriroseicoccus oceanibius]QQL45956.1 30S ribosomal protein S13 [Sulfuriroseicoccus oceanibius]